MQMASNSLHSSDYMLDQGICLAPSKYEAWFMTTAHSDEDIDATLAAAQSSFKQMSGR